MIICHIWYILRYFEIFLNIINMIILIFCSNICQLFSVVQNIQEIVMVIYCYWIVFVKFMVWFWIKLEKLYYRIHFIENFLKLIELHLKTKIFSDSKVLNVIKKLLTFYFKFKRFLFIKFRFCWYFFDKEILSNIW